MRGATISATPAMLLNLISTHTLHAGRDVIYRLLGCTYILFLLTRPMRGATQRAP